MPALPMQRGKSPVERVRAVAAAYGSQIIAKGYATRTGNGRAGPTSHVEQVARASRCVNASDIRKGDRALSELYPNTEGATWIHKPFTLLSAYPRWRCRSVKLPMLANSVLHGCHRFKDGARAEGDTLAATSSSEVRRPER